MDPKSFYQQPDGNSCGPSICMLAERILLAWKKGLPPDLKFNITDTKKWREMAHLILSCKFPDTTKDATPQSTLKKPSPSTPTSTFQSTRKKPRPTNPMKTSKTNQHVKEA
uniref:Ubiquitin-like protease family profile domain-containing protein n=1 Tax=Acrobeloides nanus TaxID=290746 RepID=A0A914DHX0_9BILA